MENTNRQAGSVGQWAIKTSLIVQLILPVCWCVCFPLCNPATLHAAQVRSLLTEISVLVFQLSPSLSLCFLFADVRRAIKLACIRRRRESAKDAASVYPSRPSVRPSVRRPTAMRFVFSECTLEIAAACPFSPSVCLPPPSRVPDPILKTAVPHVLSSAVAEATMQDILSK